MEKTIELIDLILTILLLGSLITDISVIDKILNSIENLMDKGFTKFIENPPKQLISRLSYIFKILFLVSFTLFIILFYFSKSYTILNISTLTFLYIYISLSLSISIPSRNTLKNIFKYCSFVIFAPIIIIMYDLILGVDIINYINEKNSSSFPNFEVYISNYPTFSAFFILFTTFLIIWVGGILGFLGIWVLALPVYFIAWSLIYIIYKYSFFFKISEKRKRLLYFIVFLFTLNKLFLIYYF